MSCLRRRPCSPAVKTPLEDDDLLGEILIRLPPQPSSLPRASLVCKRWRSLASDRGFIGRFRRHHRHNPPLLGIFNRDDGLSFMPTLEAPNRVPPGRFSLHRGEGDRFLSLGCRHGLVLILVLAPEQILLPKEMLVWDPVTRDRHRLAVPPGIAPYAEKTMLNGAVLRPAGEANHFQVVLAVADNDDKQHRRALACVYSSRTGIWGDLVSTLLPSGIPPSGRPTIVYTGKTAVLAGDSLYWVLAGSFAGVLEFDLVKHSLVVIRVPVHMLEEGDWKFSIMRAEGGGLGLLFQLDSRFQLWKRNTTYSDGVTSWGLQRTIELDQVLSLNSVSPIILGFAEENNVVFLWESGTVCMVHLESLEYKKLFETYVLPHYHPFESLYTAGLDLVSHSGGYDEVIGCSCCAVGSSISYVVRQPGIGPPTGQL